MGNKFTRKLKFGPSNTDKGPEGDAGNKGATDAEPNAKTPSCSVDKKEVVSEVEAKGQTAAITDTEDVKVTVPKEPKPDIPKINVEDESNEEVIDFKWTMTPRKSITIVIFFYFSTKTYAVSNDYHNNIWKEDISFLMQMILRFGLKSHKTWTHHHHCIYVHRFSGERNCAQYWLTS